MSKKRIMSKITTNEDIIEVLLKAFKDIYDDADHAQHTEAEDRDEIITDNLNNIQGLCRGALSFWDTMCLDGKVENGIIE
jgi:hypothetical protein